MNNKAAKTEGTIDNNEVKEVSLSLMEDEQSINRLQEIINRYYKMNIKCDLILYKINKIKKVQAIMAQQQKA